MVLLKKLQKERCSGIYITYLNGNIETYPLTAGETITNYIGEATALLADVKIY